MKVIDNLITEGLSGKVEQSKYCFRRHYGSTFLTLKSIPSGEETPQQRLVKSWFTTFIQAQGKSHLSTR